MKLSNQITLTAHYSEDYLPVVIHQQHRHAGVDQQSL